MGYETIYAFMTAERTDPNPADPESYEPEHGWIDPGWSMTTLHDNRNDVDPIVKASTDFDGHLDEISEEEIFDAVHEHLAAFEDNGDGTYHGQGEDQDIVTGAYWTYAIHFVRKFYGPNGYTEEPYRPAVLAHQDYPHMPGALPGCYACDYINERNA